MPQKHPQAHTLLGETTSSPLVGSSNYHGGACGPSLQIGHRDAVRPPHRHGEALCASHGSVSTNNSRTTTCVALNFESSAAWLGTRIILRQVSPESSSIFDFVIELHRTCSGDWNSLIGDDLGDHDLQNILTYMATFLSNMGNYYVCTTTMTDACTCVNPSRAPETKSLSLP